MSRALRGLSTLGASLGVAAACSGTTPDPTAPGPRPSASALAPQPVSNVRIRFELPRGGAPADMARLPWPTDLARRDDGRLDLRAHPGHGSALLGEYLTRAAEDLDGFSVAPVVYFRFDGPIDLARAPKEDTSRSPSASIVLVDVDPQSPEKGTFYPLVFHATTRDMRYVHAGTLAVRPMDGFPLRPGTLHAAAVRRTFGGVGRLATAADLDAVLASAPRADPVEERARRAHAPAVEALEAAGIPRSEIAALAVFRTGAPQAITQRLVDVIDGLFAAPGPRTPRVLDVAWLPAPLVSGAAYRVLRGAYCTPNFQAKVENAPFLEREGGRVILDTRGRPQIQDVPASAAFAAPECPGQLRARFVLSVPTKPAPPGGFPLLVTAHGTGGDASTFLGTDDFAGWAAEEGFAALSTDQPLHGGVQGGRPGAGGPLVLPMGIPVTGSQFGSSIAFYNPLYPGATLGNLHQAAADAAVLVRLFAGLDLGSLKNAAGQPLLHLGPAGAAPRLDARRVALAGHSQGCQSLAVLGAVDPHVRGVILSGCGGDARLGILHGRPIEEPIAPWISMTLGLDPEELNAFHPLMALVQSLADTIDPLAFARLYWQPPDGRVAPLLLHYEGLRDRYTPEVTAEALAIAARARPAAPLTKPVPGLTLLDLGAPDLGSRPERMFVQLAPKKGGEGHFVLYDVPGASGWFRELLRRTDVR